MLIRFCVTTDIVDAGRAGERLVVDFLRFGFCVVVFADIPSPSAGRAACSLTLDTFYRGAVPRSSVTIACAGIRKLKRSGKADSIASDGLRIGDALIASGQFRTGIAQTKIIR
jgi:hypothetical protein